jgi:hypothetical protein
MLKILLRSELSSVEDQIVFACFSKRAIEAKGLRSSSHDPAIDRDYRASHVIGQVRRQKFDHAAAVIHRSEAT